MRSATKKAATKPAFFILNLILVNTAAAPIPAKAIALRPRERASKIGANSSAPRGKQFSIKTKSPAHYPELRMLV